MELDGIATWEDIIPILMVTIFILIIVFPLIHVLASKRSHGGAKFGWFIAVFCFSWLAYIVFLIATQPQKDAQSINKTLTSHYS